MLSYLMALSRALPYFRSHYMPSDHILKVKKRDNKVNRNNFTPKYTLIALKKANKHS